MILVDTSIWIDHLRKSDAVLSVLLDHKEVISHPFVIGELALGQLQQRELALETLRDLPSAIVADEPEVLRFIVSARLFGLGIGYVDAHLLSSARLTPETRLWTRGKRLQQVAGRLSLAADLG